MPNASWQRPGEVGRMTGEAPCRLDASAAVLSGVESDQIAWKHAKNQLSEEVLSLLDGIGTSRKIGFA